MLVMNQLNRNPGTCHPTWIGRAGYRICNIQHGAQFRDLSRSEQGCIISAALNCTFSYPASNL
jgi:hypothetical protein